MKPLGVMTLMLAKERQAALRREAEEDRLAQSLESDAPDKPSLIERLRGWLRHNHTRQANSKVVYKT